MTERFDVAVVGAGPAGAATATLLAEHGCSVALLHDRSATIGPLGESLSGAAAGRLERLGVWERFRAGPHRPVHARASAWGGDLLEQPAMFDPYGPAWLIDRDAFEALLRDRAREVGVHVLTVRATNCRAEPGARWRLTLADGTDLLVGAIVDATGRSCSITRAVGGDCEVHDRMTALVGRHVPAEAPAGGPPVLVEATATGWWYSALVPSGVLVSLFMTEAAALDESTAAWEAALEAAPHTRARLRGARRDEPPAVRTVTVQRAVVHPAAAGCIAVGDAAIGLDPLSAAGLRLGFETAEQAAGAIVAALDCDRSATAAYTAWVGERLDAHLAERARYYELETRWPTAAFWAARRASRPAHVPSAPGTSPLVQR